VLDDEDVPDGDGKHRGVVRIQETHSKMHRGPLPAPETLAEYGDIDASFPERIVSAFEKQSEHRQDMERRIVAGSERRAGRGQVIGSVLVGMGLAGGILAIILGEAVAGASIIVPSLAGGVLTYLFGFGPRDK
jgi:uncharacterized membrane protein